MGGVLSALGLALLSGLELSVLLSAWLLASVCVVLFVGRWQVDVSELRGDIARGSVDDVDMFVGQRVMAGQWYCGATVGWLSDC